MVSDLGRSGCEVVEITVVVSALQRKDLTIQSGLTYESSSLLSRKTREKEQGQEHQDPNFLVCPWEASGAPVSQGG